MPVARWVQFCAFAGAAAATPAAPALLDFVTVSAIPCYLGLQLLVCLDGGLCAAPQVDDSDIELPPSWPFLSKQFLQVPGLLFLLDSE